MSRIGIVVQESATTLIKRTLLRRCPVCGVGALFRSHFHMNRVCPRCHVVFWKDPGESLGAMYVDYAVAAATFLVTWALLAWFTRASDTVTLVILSVTAAGSVLVFYPFSRSVWTLLVYLSGGIEKVPMRVLPGGKHSTEPTPRRRRAAR
ncbi:MAG TPA: hypothetical protein VEJ86_13335 [Candidatus Binataceae bacterium]|nr:hypothetical protein [Candidatus Binataceae bacterium]